MSNEIDTGTADRSGTSLQVIAGGKEPDKLTGKQLAFVQAILKGANQSDAYWCAASAHSAAQLDAMAAFCRSYLMAAPYLYLHQRHRVPGAARTCSRPAPPPEILSWPGLPFVGARSLRHVRRRSGHHATAVRLLANRPRPADTVDTEF